MAVCSSLLMKRQPPLFRGQDQEGHSLQQACFVIQGSQAGQTITCWTFRLQRLHDNPLILLADNCNAKGLSVILLANNCNAKGRSIPERKTHTKHSAEQFNMLISWASCLCHYTPACHDNSKRCHAEG
jgi:hypothetical protein